MEIAKCNKHTIGPQYMCRPTYHEVVVLGGRRVDQWTDER